MVPRLEPAMDAEMDVLRAAAGVHHEVACYGVGKVRRAAKGYLEIGEWQGHCLNDSLLL